MFFKLNTIAALFIGVGVIAGWARVKRTDRSFLPFLLILTLGLVHEAGSALVIHHQQNSMAIYNITGITEAQLVLLQFRCWKLWKPQSPWYLFWAILLLMLWMAEWLYHGNLHYPYSWFTVVYSLCIAFLTIEMIGQQLAPVRPGLYSNATFLICIGFLIFYTCAAITELFWIYGAARFAELQWHVLAILSVVNLLTNLLFTWATWCIPYSFRYIFRY